MTPGEYRNTKHVQVDSSIELREDLAKYLHDYWRRNMEYLFDQATETGDGGLELHHFDVSRWQNRMATPYDKAHMSEKDMFRCEADTILNLLKKHKI